MDTPLCQTRTVAIRRILQGEVFCIRTLSPLSDTLFYPWIATVTQG